MMTVRERVEDLHKLWKEASEVKGVRDVTADFAVRSKQRDVIAACRVRIILTFGNNLECRERKTFIKQFQYRLSQQTILCKSYKICLHH